MSEKEFQKRIGYDGDIKPVLEDASSSYDLGEYIAHEIFTFGYEDFNARLTTSKGDFFVKIFSNRRSLDDCKRYVSILEQVLKAGVRHPNLFKVKNGHLYLTKITGVDLRLCVMEYIDSGNLFETKGKLNKAEMRDIIQQATRINAIKTKYSFIYDSWAITNFLKEFKEVQKFLDKEDLELITPLLKEFENIPIKNLPHCFVHGDIIKTNVIKSKRGELFIVDFSVANYYPRIIELAILLCNLFFDEDNLESFPEYYKLSLSEYQKSLKLTLEEIERLPLFLKIAHAMHIIPATKEKVLNNNTSEENMYWLNLGKIGLRYTTKLF